MDKIELPVNLPNNIEGVNIHLSYIRKDIDSLSKKIDEISSSFVTNQEFQEHLKADEDHEARIRLLQEFQDTLMGKIWGVGIVASLIMGAATIAINHYYK